MVRDELRIGEADGNVVSGWSKLLEVGRFVDLDEGFVVLAAVESVGLEPLFTAGNAVRRGGSNDAVTSGRHTVHNGLTAKWGQSRAVRLVLRADRDHAGDCATVESRAVKSRMRIFDDRARVDPAVRRIGSSRQCVRQRLTELVVGHLSGSVARSTDQVEDGDVESAEAGLVGRQSVDTAAGIMLAVERMIIFEYEYRDFGRGLALRLDEYGYRGKSTGAGCCRGYRSAGRSNLRAAHGMSRVNSIAWEDRNVVVLARIQNDFAGK